MDHGTDKNEVSLSPEEKNEETPEGSRTADQGQEKEPVGPNHDNNRSTQESQDTPQSLRDAALRYSDIGWAVFPVHGIKKNGRCSCGDPECPNPGKHPRIRDWPKKSTIDKSQISAWWAKWSGANIGVITGEKNGLVVLDIDPRNGGEETLARLAQEKGLLPPTVESETGGGGRHVFFQYPDSPVKSRPGGLGPGIDVKAAGGCVVAQPSRHASGQPYKWKEGCSPDEIEVAPLPNWLVGLLRMETIPEQEVSPGGGLPQDRILKGQRNDQLFHMGIFMWHRRMCKEAIEDALLRQNNLRCDPPLSEDEVRGVVESIEMYPRDDVAGSHAAGSSTRPTISAQIICVARRVCEEFFIDETSTPFVRIPVNEHVETWPLESRQFERRIAEEFYRVEGKVPNSQALKDARRILAAECEKGSCHQLHNRVGFFEGAIWYDMGDESWRAVRVAADGWEIVERPPILFRRYQHQQPQIEPIKGGDASALLEFVNLPDDSSLKLLVLVYLISCFLPDISHPILVLTGPQGSAKSTFFRILRAITDPSATGTLSFPRDQSELVQQLQHNFVAFFDNITAMHPRLSDTLCRASTGEGVSKRRLYTDDDDIIYNYRRVVGINGILNPANRPDFLDRSIVIALNRIGGGKRKTDAELREAFGRSRPRIFGGCLDVLVTALKLYPEASLPELPRMADFAVWGACIAQGLGYSQQEFLSAYQRNIAELNEMAIEAQPFIQAVRKIMDENQGYWKGTATELLTEANRVAKDGDIDIESKKWPANASWATKRLMEGLANLQEDGIEVDLDRSGQRTVIIRRWTQDGQ